MDESWDEQLRLGRRHRRGEIFSIVDVSRGDGALVIRMGSSDYAHYIATILGLLPTAEAARVVFTSVVPTTSDGRLVLGKMNGHTASPGRVQPAGGGIERCDLADGTFDLVGCALRELREELAVDGTDLEDPCGQPSSARTIAASSGCCSRPG